MSIINKIKKYIKNILAAQESKKNSFKNSKSYWENRYKQNGSSGAGSYGRLAEFKAEVLNSFVKENNIKTVLELGCGDGNQLKLAVYPSYLGLDVSKTAIKICKAEFLNDKTKAFQDYMSFFKSKNEDFELTISLDVIYHLIEDVVFEEYMMNLFSASVNYVIIYASNYDKIITDHVKSRNFTAFVKEKLFNEWDLCKHIENKYPFNEKDPNNTSISDFYFFKRK